MTLKNTKSFGYLTLHHHMGSDSVIKEVHSNMQDNKTPDEKPKKYEHSIELSDKSLKRRR